MNVENVSDYTSVSQFNLVTESFVPESALGRLPLWASGQSSWLQIQRPGFDFRRYQIFWEIVDLERGPFSLESTIEELLGWKNSGSCLETEITAVGIRHADHVAPSIRKSWH
jgi:hypothetical protein